MLDNLACPKCHHTDKILKVSAIISGQTHQIHGSSHESQTYVDKDGKTHTSYYTAPYDATQTSVLAQQLRPPRQPQVENRSSCGWIIWVILFLVAVVFFGPIVNAVVILLILMIAAPFNPSDTFSSFNMPARVVISFVGLAIVAVGLLIAFFVIRAIFRAVNAASAQNAEKRKREIAQVQAEMPRWEHAMQRWNQLYYCERDDLVFVPGEDTGAPLQQMMDYIYK